MINMRPQMSTVNLLAVQAKARAKLGLTFARHVSGKSNNSVCLLHVNWATAVALGLCLSCKLLALHWVNFASALGVGGKFVHILPGLVPLP